MNNQEKLQHKICDVLEDLETSLADLTISIRELRYLIIEQEREEQ